MNNISRKVTVILLVTVSSMFICVSSIFAAVNTPVYKGKYTQGVGNITIYIDGASNAGYWEKYIKGGANNWMYLGQECLIRFTFNL